MSGKALLQRILPALLAVCFAVSLFVMGNLPSKAATKYKIDVKYAVATVNGQPVTEATPGETVILTGAPPEGYYINGWWNIMQWDGQYLSDIDITYMEDGVTFVMPAAEIRGELYLGMYVSELNFVYIPEVGAKIERGDSLVETGSYWPEAHFCWYESTDGVEFGEITSETFEVGKYYKIEVFGLSDASPFQLADNIVFKLNGVVCTEDEYRNMVDEICSNEKTYGPLVAKSYNITVKNGTATVNGKAATTAKAGDVVTIKANAVSGKTFNGWSTTLSVANKNAESTTFTMPASNVTVEATYKNNPVSSSSNQGSSATTNTNTTTDKPSFNNGTTSAKPTGTSSAKPSTNTTSDKISNTGSSTSTKTPDTTSDIFTDSISDVTDVSTDAVTEEVSDVGSDVSSQPDSDEISTGMTSVDSNKASASTQTPAEPKEKLSTGAVVAIATGSTVGVGGGAAAIFVFRQQLLSLLKKLLMLFKK